MYVIFILLHRCFILGEPKRLHVEIPGVTKDVVAGAENASASPEVLADQLLLALFTEDEMRIAKNLALYYWTRAIRCYLTGEHTSLHTQNT